MLCCEASCDTCDTEYDCTRGLKEWANSEYVEPQVDWSRVPVDTPILVRDSESSEWKRRYFAKYKITWCMHGKREQHHGVLVALHI